MEKEQAIEFFKTRTHLAEALGVDNSTVTRWKKIPMWHQRAIETLTGGKLKAERKPEKKQAEMYKVCYMIPTETYRNFKKLCVKQRVSMCKKVTELIQNEITNI